MFVQNKVAVGRELSMDRVSKPTNYEPPRGGGMGKGERQGLAGGRGR